MYCKLREKYFSIFDDIFILIFDQQFTFRSEVTMSRPTNATTLANPLNELKLFLSTPIDKFKLRNPAREYVETTINVFIFDFIAQSFFLYS